MTQSYPDVRVGDLWRSLDPRDVARNRRVEVEAVKAEFVHVRSYLAGRLGRASRIHISRFDGQQFELLTRPDQHSP